MADIFISYSKRDAETVRLLAAALEAQGWSVWWDTSLGAGDAFRNVIMTELAKARAVIVVWTKTSVASEWVMSEAGRGHADRKLIPVRARDLDYKAIPPPFDNLHTEYVDAHERIAAAVVAQLAKPQVTPSVTWLATKELRYQILTWVSIVGGVLTLFTSASALVQLSEVARQIVDHWQAWMQAVWQTLFGWIGFKLPKPWAAILTGCTFLIGIAIGQRVQSQLATGTATGSFKPGLWWWPFAAGVASLGLLVAAPDILRYTIGPEVFFPIAFIVTLTAPIASAKNKRVATAGVMLAMGLLSLLVLVPLFAMPSILNSQGPRPTAPEEDPIFAIVFSFTLLSWLIPATVLAIAPAKPLLRRLGFLAIGLGILLALNGFAVHGHKLAFWRVAGP